MASKVAELFADFRINWQKATLDVLNTTLGELRLGTIAEVASLAGLTRMLFSVGEGAMKTATHLHMLATVYGLNTERLQDMERAGLGANVSVEALQASVLGLQQNLAALNLGHVNGGFLEAAGFFGIGVAPGMGENELMDKLFRNVPGFVKAHGAMGKAMAASLLGQMGMNPEALQYILAGKQAKGGADVKDPTREALTKVSNSMDAAAFDIKNLTTNAIAPLVEILGPISDYLQTIAAVAGGADNLAHPARTAEGLVEAFKGKLAERAYITPAEARARAADALAVHRGVLPSSSAVPASLHPAMIASMISAHAPAGPSSTHETKINVYGVEDEKIAGAVRRASDAAHAKAKRDYAINAAVHNPVGQ